MHEMALAEGVLQIIEDAAHAQQFHRVKTVWLEIGQLAGVEREALAFCFDAVTRGSLAEQARLEMVELPGRGWCLPCGREIALPALYEPCPHCGGHQVQVTGGNQMRVKELEVE